MRRMRFLAFALISFVVALFGALLSPSTWLHKSLAVALCGVLSANPALCTNNAIAVHSQEASATNPVKVETTQFSDLLADRASEFDTNQPTTPPSSTNNRSVPAYPQQVNPNTPIRSEFDNPIQDATSGATSTVIRQATGKKCDYPPPVYTIYINGINTERKAYAEDSRVIESLLQEVGVRFSPYLRQETYNPTGKILNLPGGGSIRFGDFFESFLQTVSSDRLFMTPSGKKLIESVEKSIKDFDKQYEDVSYKSDCDCKIPKPKYLFFGHSQGNFFVEDIVKSLPRSIQERTAIFSTASFTSYPGIDKSIVRFDYLIRPDDFPAFIVNHREEIKRFITDVGNKVIDVSNKIPTTATESTAAISSITTSLALKSIDLINTAGKTNLNPLLETNTAMIDPIGEDWKNFLKLLDSHLIQNYLGKPKPYGKEGVNLGAIYFPTVKSLAGSAFIQPLYEVPVQESHDKAVAKLKNLLSDQVKYYEKKQCQKPQQPSTSQISNATTNSTNEVKQIRNCRVGKFMPEGSWNPGLCVIQGSVMTAEGFVDGKSECGTCNLFIGDLPPHKGSCETRPLEQPGIRINIPIPLPGLSGPNLNTPVPCPSNWDSGW